MIAGATLPAIIASRYRPLRFIAAGGMGAVYEVEHVHTGERLALKVLSSGARASPNALARFKHEARASARIKSDNVVRVTDADVAPELGGVPFGSQQQGLDASERALALYRTTDDRLPRPVARIPGPVIEPQRAENTALGERLGQHRLRLTDGERRRLAGPGKAQRHRPSPRIAATYFLDWDRRLLARLIAPRGARVITAAGHGGRASTKGLDVGFDE